MTSPAVPEVVEVKASEAEVRRLASPRSVRARAAEILREARGGGTAFEVSDEGMETAVQKVAEVTMRSYPGGFATIPAHTRWEHFKAGGRDRVGEAKLNPAQKLDLVVVSVLLDAGAGARWSFDGHGRSEGLALASLDMFLKGAFSRDPARDPRRADANALMALTPEKLAEGFRVSGDNPLEGLEGRAGLLRRLGTVMTAKGLARPSDLLIRWKKEFGAGGVPASELLTTLLLTLGSLWPARVRVGGVGFGDVWARGAPSLATLVPFHKLPQWLTYSVIAPVEESGVPVKGIEELTGLPEYRNGGLLLDTGALLLRDPANAAREWAVGDPLVVEWRALTVALLDELAARFRAVTGRSESQLPLAKVLQGGTWTAGREAARERRPDGGPPLRLKLDGTVF